MSDFDQERKWSSWFHRPGKTTKSTGMTAQTRAGRVRKISASRKAAQDKGE